MGHFTCKRVVTTGIIGAIAGDCFVGCVWISSSEAWGLRYIKELVLRIIWWWPWLLQPKGWKCRKNWLVVYIIMCLMIIFGRYLMSLTGSIKQDSCWLWCQQESLSKTGLIVPTLLAFSLWRQSWWWRIQICHRFLSTILHQYFHLLILYMWQFEMRSCFNIIAHRKVRLRILLSIYPPLSF